MQESPKPDIFHKFHSYNDQPDFPKLSWKSSFNMSQSNSFFKWPSSVLDAVEVNSSYSMESGLQNPHPTVFGNHGIFDNMSLNESERKMSIGEPERQLSSQLDASFLNQNPKFDVKQDEAMSIHSDKPSEQNDIEP